MIGASHVGSRGRVPPLRRRLPVRAPPELWLRSLFLLSCARLPMHPPRSANPPCQAAISHRYHSSAPNITNGASRREAKTPSPTSTLISSNQSFSDAAVCGWTLLTNATVTRLVNLCRVLRIAKTHNSFVGSPRIRLSFREKSRSLRWKTLPEDKTTAESVGRSRRRH